MILALISTSTTQVAASFDLLHGNGAGSLKAVEDSNSFHQNFLLQNDSAAKTANRNSRLATTLNQNNIADTSPSGMNHLTESEILFSDDSSQSSHSMHHVLEENPNGDLVTPSDRPGVHR